MHGGAESTGGYESRRLARGIGGEAYTNAPGVPLAGLLCLALQESDAIMTFPYLGVDVGMFFPLRD